LRVFPNILWNYLKPTPLTNKVELVSGDLLGGDGWTPVEKFPLVPILENIEAVLSRLVSRTTSYFYKFRPSLRQGIQV